MCSGVHLSHTHSHTSSLHTHTHMYRAISLEPTLSDAYWHRHALFLLQSNEEVYTIVHSQIVLQFSANTYHVSTQLFCIGWYLGIHRCDTHTHTHTHTHAHTQTGCIRRFTNCPEAQQKALWSISIKVFLSVCLCVCLSVCLSFILCQFLKN